MSAPSNNSALWHGTVRETILRISTVNHDKYVGCELCFVTCGRGVYNVKNTMRCLNANTTAWSAAPPARTFTP